MQALLATFPRTGRVDWIGRSPERRAAIDIVDEVEVLVGFGITGDRHASRGGGKRQVTLIQAEHLPVIASLAGLLDVPPELVRRNIVVGGISLHAMRNSRFRVGEVLLEGTGSCAPCSRMEEYLGPGGYNAMRGMGGVTARVIEAGVIRIGDDVTFVGDPPPPAADSTP